MLQKGFLFYAWSNSLLWKTRKYVRKNRQTYQYLEYTYGLDKLIFLEDEHGTLPHSKKVFITFIKN